MREIVVSIIIPVFNRADLLHETLEGFILQTYQNWECLLVDDGSTDNTVEVIKKYQKKDTRFKLHNRPPKKLKGANACRNYGFEVSKGSYINWFDSDDIPHPDFLKERVTLLQKFSEIDMAACYGERFYNDGRPNSYMKPVDDKTDNIIENYILHDFCFYTNSPLWRREFLFNQNDLFDETMHRSQEKDFHFRIVCNGLIFKRYTEKPLFFKRGDNESITSKAGSDIQAKKSVFKLRKKQYELIAKSENTSKKMLIEYLFYRQADNYYNLVMAVSKNNRKAIMSEYYPQLLKMSKNEYLDRKVSKKIIFGNAVLKYFHRGYKYFYFPQFDYRSF